METAIAYFRNNKIPVFTAKDAEPKTYEKSVAAANRLYRFARPDCVVLPENASHVVEIVKQARLHDLRLTIKCNGHSYAGHSTADTGISLDLRRMQKEVIMDEKAMTMTMDAGCQWGQVYKVLVNNRKTGWVVNGGRCPNVGVSGYTLGSGLGPFTRSFGMGSDTLLEAQIVTATGKLVTVKKDDKPTSDKGKLFWALCGAGGGNFGVVVRLTMKIQQLSSPGGKVVSGRALWFPEASPDIPKSKSRSNLEANREFMDTMKNFYTRPWPNQLTIDSTWNCEPNKDSDFVRFLIYFDGSRNDYRDIIDEHVRNEDLKSLLKERALPEPSTRFLHETLVDQWAEETERAKPNDEKYHIYSSFVFKNDRPTITEVTSLIRQSIVDFRQLFANADVLYCITWIHSGGKATQRKPQDSAFFWREAVYHVYTTIEWKDKWLEQNMWYFMHLLKRKLRPLSLNGAASFINFPDLALEDNAYEQAYFGDNFRQLREVKKIWDPDCFFKFAQGIKLPGSESSTKAESTNPSILADRLAGMHWDKFETEMTRDLDDLREMGYD